MTKLTHRAVQEAALVVIDMQKGFLDDDSGFGRAIGDISRQQSIIPGVRELVGVCREAGMPVLWSRQVHFRDDQTRSRRHFPTHLQKRGIEAVLYGTDEVEIVESLQDSVAPEDHVFVKHRASCFYNTTLETKLRMMGVQVVVICGINSNYCVDSTVRDAYFREFDVLLVKDCVSGTFDDLTEAFIKNFDIYFGLSLTVDELRAELTELGAPQQVA